MIKHLPFLRWWLLASLIAISSYFLNEFGICEEVWETDQTFISVSIVGIFLVMSFWCGIKTFILGKEHNQKQILQIRKQENIGWFVADLFTMLGFVGTIYGMIIALKGFDGINPADVLSIQKLISSLVHGVSIALYTTLTGLICSLLLKVQYFNLSYDLESKQEE